MKSDKEFWHRYMDFYWKSCFKYIHESEHILEWGVGWGASTQFFVDYFPYVNVTACDNQNVHPDWPIHPRIHYRKVDQSKREEVNKFFLDYKFHFNLIIDDGSHVPADQATCLIEGIKYTTYYIVEDLQTNLNVPGSPLYFLLALEHYLATGKSFNFDHFQSNFFTPSEIYLLVDNIKKVELFRRASLPLTCYMCKSDQHFDFQKLECTNCKIPLYNLDDSITAVILTN